MAQYRFSPSIVSRGKGQSVIAKAAYNARENIRDERTGEMKRYSHQPGLEFAGIFAPKDAPAWAKDRAALWNAVELREDQQPNKKNRAEAQLARYLELNLPHELDAEQRKQLVRDFAREQFQRKGMVADVAIHEPHAHGDQRNYHAHILLTMRELGPEGFGGKVREWNSKEFNLEWREKWAELGARYLEKAGFELEAERYRVGHLKLEKQREAALERFDLVHAEAVNHPPTKHLGPQLAAMERNGVETERGNAYRDTYTQNEQLAALKTELSGVEKQIEATARDPEPWIAPWEQVDRQFRVAAHEVATVQPEITAPEEIKRQEVRQIWEAYQRSDNAKGFAAALQDSGMMLSGVTNEEARASEIDSHYAKQAGKFTPIYREGEILVVTPRTNVFRLTSFTTGAERSDIEKRMASVDPKTLQSVGSGKQIMQDRAEIHEIERQAFRDLSGVGVLKREPELGRGSIGKDPSLQPVKAQAEKAVGKALESLVDISASLIELFGDAVSATPLTPERIQAKVEAHEQAVVEAAFDRERFMVDEQYRRLIETQEAQKLEQQRQRDYYLERERDGRER